MPQAVTARDCFGTEVPRDDVKKTRSTRCHREERKRRGDPFEIREIEFATPL